MKEFLFLIFIFSFMHFSFLVYKSERYTWKEIGCYIYVDVSGKLKRQKAVRARVTTPGKCFLVFRFLIIKYGVTVKL
jgi:hypothetical protein